MSELEIMRQIITLQTEENLLLKKDLLGRTEQIQHLNDLIENQNKIIDLQKLILNEFVPQIRPQHLKLVKNENE